MVIITTGISRIALVDQFCCFDAVQVGHADIRQDHVGVQVLGQLDHFIPVRGFPDHLDIGLGVKQQHESLADHDMVVSDQYLDLLVARNLLYRGFPGGPDGKSWPITG